MISLIHQTPFDDRINTQASVEDISPLLVREYLQNVNSSLAKQIETTPINEIYRAMDLTSGPSELLYPKNIVLMMFNYRPEKFFPYSRIEIVEFPNGLGDPVFMRNQQFRVIDVSSIPGKLFGSFLPIPPLGSFLPDRKFF